MNRSPSTYSPTISNLALIGAEISMDFTGKERDDETGYGYFGARYMDHELMTMWLSVDPMADKYPGISPYAYCAWNPVKLMDPDGRDTIYSFACNTGDRKTNESNQRILDCMRNIGNSSCVVAVSMHGSPKAVDMATSDGKSTVPLSAKRFADRIRCMQDGSDLYVSNRDEGKSTIIVMYSCETGKGENCFGQQLSSELESSIVIAPEGLVWTNLNANGKTTVDNATNKGTPKLLQKGARQNWNVFYHGEKATSFKGSAPQAWINKQGGVNKVIENIKKHVE